MITAKEARGLAPIKDVGVEKELSIIETEIREASIDGEVFIDLQRIFNRFDLFLDEHQGAHLNEKGKRIQKTLENEGFQLAIREDRWNDGPDFFVYWGKPEDFNEIFKYTLEG